MNLGLGVEFNPFSKGTKCFWRKLLEIVSFYSICQTLNKIIKPVQNCLGGAGGWIESISDQNKILKSKRVIFLMHLFFCNFTLSKYCVQIQSKKNVNVINFGTKKKILKRIARYSLIHVCSFFFCFVLNPFLNVTLGFFFFHFWWVCSLLPLSGSVLREDGILLLPGRGLRLLLCSVAEDQIQPWEQRARGMVLSAGLRCWARCMVASEWPAYDLPSDSRGLPAANDWLAEEPQLSRRWHEKRCLWIISVLLLISNVKGGRHN